MAELFEEVEINRKPFWPRLARTAALSVALHLAFALAVLYAPTVRAFWQLASMVTGTDYGDEAYELGEVRERAVIIKPTEKLYYPPGYFNPNQPAAEDAQVVEEPTPAPTPTPTPRPAAARPTPTPEVAMTEEERREKERKEREELDKLAEKSKVRLPPKVNARPFKDMLVKWNDEYEQGRLDLNGTIEVTLEADRNEDGTLTNMEMTGGSATDPALKELAKDVVRTLSASGVLSFLQGARHLKMRLRLDQQKLSVVALTEVESEAQATQMSVTFNVGIGFERFRTAGKDENQVWKNTRVSAKGRQITVEFEMPRGAAGDLLARQVSKAKEGQ